MHFCGRGVWRVDLSVPYCPMSIRRGLSLVWLAICAGPKNRNIYTLAGSFGMEQARICSWSQRTHTACKPRPTKQVLMPMLHSSFARAQWACSGGGNWDFHSSKQDVTYTSLGPRTGWGS